MFEKGEDMRNAVFIYLVSALIASAGEYGIDHEFNRFQMAIDELNPRDALVAEQLSRILTPLAAREQECLPFLENHTYSDDSRTSVAAYLALSLLSVHTTMHRHSAAPKFRERISYAYMLRLIRRIDDMSIENLSENLKTWTEIARNNFVFSLDQTIDSRSKKGVILYQREKFDEAISLFREGSADRDPLSLYMLGLCKERGEGTARDSTQALSLYRQSAERGYPYAWRALGVCYRDGIGTPRDLRAAHRYFTNAINGGVNIALTDLGAMYLSGNGVPQDEHKGFDLYLQAANRGDPLAKQNLGELYFFGRHVSRDFTKAHRWILDAAKDGYILSIAWVVALADSGHDDVTPIPEDHIWRHEIKRHNLDEATKQFASLLSNSHSDCRRCIIRASEQLSRQCYSYGLQK